MPIVFAPFLVPFVAGLLGWRFTPLRRMSIAVTVPGVAFFGYALAVFVMGFGAPHMPLPACPP